ncbi:hypothetical protein [Methanosphaera sp. WGK6]|uniref:hypothetical protein n=1 Tax=Methanosphaera sp. WGK6 TaxID=1561964 RepID=UPI00084BD834|nr:hypothetical protein [Methanosphaera sp. WGK6]OED30914.1 hypothetical protein NL43_00985 [Methanosphaera sp. WGK6]
MENKIIRTLKKDKSIKQLPEEEQKKIKQYTKKIFKILKYKTIKTIRKKLNEILDDKKDAPQSIKDIITNFIRTYLSNLTYALENKNIEKTSNKIEKYVPKTISKTHKKKNEITKRNFK